MRLLDALADSADALFALSSGSGGTNICSAAMCMSTFFSSSFTPTLCLRLRWDRNVWQFGQGLLLLRLTRDSASVILPLVRRGLFQLRQQTLAESCCVSTQRSARLTGSAFRNH